MNPYLSIIVPIYNVEQYLHQCIDSILDQTFRDFELILVDDGSLDNCTIICDEYAEKDVRVKVIHKANGGLVSARKAGLSVASGVYVGYVDGDDWIEKDMYSLLCDAAISSKADIVICDIIQCYPDKEIRFRQPIEYGFYDKEAMKKFIYPFMLYSGTFYKFGLYPAVWNKIFRRRLLEQNQYNVDDKLRLGEDSACTYPCMLDANSLFVLDNKFLYHYRQIESSMTRRYDTKFFPNIINLYQSLKKSNSEKGIYDLSEQLNYYLGYLFLAAVDNEFKKSNQKSNKEKRNFIRLILKNTEIANALKQISVAGFPIKYKISFRLILSHKVNFMYFFITVNKLIRKYQKLGTK